MYTGPDRPDVVEEEGDTVQVETPRRVAYPGVGEGWRTRGDYPTLCNNHLGLALVDVVTSTTGRSSP